MLYDRRIITSKNGRRLVQWDVRFEDKRGKRKSIKYSRRAGDFFSATCTVTSHVTARCLGNDTQGAFSTNLAHATWIPATSERIWCSIPAPRTHFLRFEFTIYNWQCTGYTLRIPSHLIYVSHHLPPSEGNCLNTWYKQDFSYTIASYGLWKTESQRKLINASISDPICLHITIW